MKVAIVYESLFGNTHLVAEAIRDGVRAANPAAEVDCLPVSDASPDLVAAADVVVVGGPTHMRGMTSALSRKMGITAEQKAVAEGIPAHNLEPGAEGPGVRDWFDTLPKAAKGRRAAAFDTRGAGRLAGGAAPGIARRLRRHGYDLVADPEGFLIDGSNGPLHPGEVERAKAWGAQLVATAEVPG
jgi:flavodoxin